MFQSELASLRDERQKYEECLAKLVAWEPPEDPGTAAKAKGLDFLRCEVADMSRDIEAFRVVDLCLNNMQPQTSKAGPASPVTASEDENG